MSKSFEFPKIHSFPPFYTKQPNQTILNQQLESWMNIVLTYCEFYKITSLSIDGIPKFKSTTEENNALPPIFSNDEIKRNCNSEFKHLILQHLIHQHKAEFINQKKPELGIYIYWRSLVGWSDLLYQYVDKTGQRGAILTIYELTQPDDSEGYIPQELKNLDTEFLIKIIKEVLVKQGKAQLLINEDNEIGGVKIV
ncbi:unnamed protein product [Candida verbasci]|uniref:Vacuolar protein-sorting-associated protein 25 n=1 Tax=Candida verbasci TaxID=1227364 RepID=A0A9W4U0E1_9ASCO|nr:unnamed protein product [Candida verbasci]